MIDADGNIRWVYDTTNVLRDDHGLITHYHGYLIDISHQKISKEALRMSEKQLKKAQHIARLGYWQWERQADRLVISKAVYAILGLDPATFNPGRTKNHRL